MTAPYYQGMYHPGVIQNQGAGGALAGGLDTVLAAILQKKQLDQQSQMIQATLAQKQAETEQAMALAKNIGAETDLHKQELKKNEQAMQEHQEDKAHQTAALGWLMGNSDVANDPIAFGKRMQQGVMNKSVTPEMFPYLLSARDKSLEFGKSLAVMQKDQATAATDTAKLPFVGPEARAGIAEKNAQAAEARVNAGKGIQEISDKQQKASDQEMQKFLLANNNDPMKAYASYIQTKKMANTRQGAALGPETAMKFQALAKSPVDELKPAQQIQVTKMFGDEVKDYKHRGEAYGLANDAMNSAISGNKAAIGSTYNRFVQAVDQDKNLRYQMLIYLKSNIDPDLPDAFKKAVDEKFHGTIPANVLKDMHDHMMTLRAGDVERYMARQKFYSDKYPQLADKFQPAEVYFGKDEDYQLKGAANSQGGDLQSQYNALRAQGVSGPDALKRLGQ